MPNWFQAGCAPPFAILGTSGFGQVDEKTEVIENNKSNSRETYKEYYQKDKYAVGKYASENEPASADSEGLEKEFEKTNKSPVRGSRAKHEKELVIATKGRRNPPIFCLPKSKTDL